MRSNSKKVSNVPVYTEQESFVNPLYKDFTIASYQDKEPEAMKRVAPHRHTYYEIIWVQSGEGNHIIDFRDYPFKGPCLFLLHPQQIHTMHKHTPTKGGVVKFSASFLPPEDADRDFFIKYGVFDDIDVMPVINLNEEQEQTIRRVFQDMYDAHRQPSSFSAGILAAYLKIFILKIYEIKKTGMDVNAFQDADFIRYRKFQVLLNDQFIHHHDPGFYAAALHVSSKTLTNCTQRFTGRPPSELIRDRLLLQAKRLLHHSVLSVKEVAFETGFEDPSYFIRFFKKNMQMSPGEFREREG
jgi:AraC-like DNA-binding protein